MNISLFQIIVAVVMVGVVVGLVIALRQYMAGASERRMMSMLERVGLDPAIASSGDTEAIMKAVRRRCRRCSTEALCERWLAGDEAGDNVFCPNAKVFEALRATAGG
ncbi:MAG: DUF6455 family protein [Gammaproteobacteria bacterium]